MGEGPVYQTMTIPFHIRHATDKDLTALVKLLEQLFSIEQDFEVDPDSGKQLKFAPAPCNAIFGKSISQHYRITGQPALQATQLSCTNNC